METETETMPRAQAGAVRRTYGSRLPKTDPAAEAEASSLARDTSSSDLTALSQLTGYAGTSSSSSSQPEAAAVKQRKPLTLDDSGYGDDGNDGNDDDNRSNSSHGEGSDDVLPGRQSIADILKTVDQAFDKASQQDDDPAVKAFLDGTRATLKGKYMTDDPNVSDLQPVGPVRESASPSAPRQSLPSANATRPDRLDESEPDEETRPPAARERKVQIQKRRAGAVLGSSDDEADSEKGSTSASGDDKAGEERLPDLRDGLIMGDVQRSKPSGDKKDTDRQRLFRNFSPESSDDDLVVANTQEVEDIEQYRESQEKNRVAQDPKHDIQTKPKSKHSDAEKIKKLTKAEEEDMHRTSEAIIRSQSVGIAPRSRKARPLSEIAARLGRKVESSATSGFNLISIHKRSAPSRSATPSVPPTSSIARLPLSEILREHDQGSKMVRPQPRPIVIGSSSAILDEDSYDTRFLNAESQSQSGGSIAAHVNVGASGTSTIKSSSAGDSAKVLSRLAAISDDENLEEEELPGLDELLQAKKREQALRDKKAALLMRQQILEEERQVKLREHEDSYVDAAAKGRDKGKGKAKEALDQLVLHSDSDDLEIVVPTAPTPKIERSARKTSRHRGLESILRTRERATTEDVTTESQLRRAGRTFGQGDSKMFVDPHVSSRIANQKKAVASSTRRSAANNGVSHRAVNGLLLQKAMQQGRQDKQRRMEDHQRRGGTLREDTNPTGAATTETGQEDRNNTDRTEQTRNLIQNMVEDVERVGLDAYADEDRDDEDDEDYLGSDEAGAQDSGAEYNSADDWGSADEDAPAKDTATDVESETEDDARATAGAVEDDTTRAVVQTLRSPDSADEDDLPVHKPQPKARAMRAVVDEDDTDGDGSEGQRRGSDADETRLAAAVDDAFAKPRIPAFPTFNPGKMANISLTQAFGNPEATQPKQQADRAIFEDGEGFSQMFAEEDGFADSQLLATPSQAQPRALPGIFAKGVRESPAIKHNPIGEAPRVIDFALRDAEIQEEAEMAFAELQRKREEAAAGAERSSKFLATTPGSTISEDLPPVSPVSDALRAPHSASSTGNLSRSITPTDVAESLPRSEARTDESFGVNDEESQLSPSAAARGRLRRAGQMMLDSSSVSPEPELAHETDKTLNAFDLLKEAQKKQLTAQERKEKRKANQFVAEQADESEDDTPSAALRKAADGDDDEGSDSDLDGSVEGLVDDQGVPDEEKEEQDKLARDKHQEQVAADAEKLGKRIEKIVAGQERKRKAAEDLLDDSDYEDDEGAFLKKARAKKPKKFGKITEALAANERTAAFAGVMMDTDGDAMGSQMVVESQYLVLDVEEEASGSDADEDDGASESNLPGTRHARNRSYTAVRDYTPDLDEINGMIWDQPSSPAMELAIGVTNKLTAVPKKPSRPAHDDFADLDEMYTQTETQFFVRKTVIIDKEESQNERGIGPGRTSAVTAFARRQDSGRSDGSSSRSSGPSRSISASSRSNSLNSLNGNKPVQANNFKRSDSTSSSKGRLALARMGGGKKVTVA